VAILSSNRKITWQGNVGVDGGIPTRNTIFADVTDAPYSAVGNGVADDTSAIQDCIDACTAGQVVYLPAGTYKITSPLKIKSGITVRGAGATSIIKGASGYTDYCLFGFEHANWTWGNDYEADKSVSAGVTKGSTSLTVASHGYSPGDILLIDSEDDDDLVGDPAFSNKGVESSACTWCGRDNGERCMGQIFKAAAGTTGNTIVPDVGLYYAYPNSPQISRMDNSLILSEAGLEDLVLDNSDSCSSAQENYGTVWMVACVDCWLKDVEVDTVYKTGIMLSNCYRCTVNGCEDHVSLNYTANAGYGLWLADSASACLIENNYFHDLTVGMIMNGPVSGNVISYNFFTDMKSTDYPTAIRSGILLHGAHPIMNLFEGNYLDGPGIEADLYWGTSSHNTFHRNFVAVDTTKTSGVVNVMLWRGCQYYNIIGGVYGTDGHENNYENESPYDYYNIYSWDYYAGGSTDGKTEGTLILHGNWDYVTDSIVWDGGGTSPDDPNDHDIPNSYYLPSKPSWWGSGGWPVIGSDLSPMVSTIPADPNYVPTADTSLEFSTSIKLVF